MSDQSVILQYLQSIEGKIDNIQDSVKGHGDRINSIEHKQAEQGGIFKAVLFISGIVSSIISFLATIIHK